MKTFAPLLVLASFLSIVAAAPVEDHAIVQRGIAGSKREGPADDVDDSNVGSCKLVSLSDNGCA